ncbi:MAG: hypothetical protein HY040_22605 [Planctomycetes bacterium]|nr:hypothetical protein [Planctomycetota bacterium]
MALLTLLAMVTFVLCQGIGGDLGDRIMFLFRGHSGQHLATAGGVKLYESDLRELKIHRNIANDAFRKCGEAALHIIKARLKELGGAKVEDERNDDRKRDLTQLGRIQFELEQRMQKRWFFGSGVKLEELVDFKLWLQQADRLGIDLRVEDVLAMVGREFFVLPPNERRGAFLAARTPNTNETTVINAVRDEFRVRIAQLTVMKAQIEDQQRSNQEDVMRKFSSRVDYRIVPTPAEVWEFYLNNAAPVDLLIVPVEVQAFAQNVAAPNDVELKPYFEQYQKKAFDPSLETPGFQIPAKIKVEWVGADPDSPLYRQKAKTALLAEAASPCGWNVLESPLATAAAYAFGEMALKKELKDVYDFRIQNVTRKNFSPPRIPGLEIPTRSELFPTPYDIAPQFSGDVYPSLLAYFAPKYSEGAAGWVGALSQGGPGVLTSPWSYLAHAQVHHAREIASGLQEEARIRTPLHATLVASAAGSPFLSAAQVRSLADDIYGWSAEGLESLNARELRKHFQYLPLAVVEDEMQKILERRLAEKWVNENMTKLRTELEKPKVLGSRSGVDRILKEYVDKLGLEHKGTEGFHTRYDIAKAKELEPLRKAYEKTYDQINLFEGRKLTPEQILKEDEFAKLFFDASEAFSAAGAPYKARTWPPTVTPKNPTLIANQKGLDDNKMFAAMLDHIQRPHDPTKPLPSIQLFDKAERPFLFWKTAEQPAKIPDTLDQVRDNVEKAWRVDKARDSGLKRAKEIAEAFQKDATSFLLTDEARKLGKEPIRLEGIAPMVPEKVASILEPRKYAPYVAPKGTFDFPRDDMATELTKLTNLKKPIETGKKDVDDINITLFKVGDANKHVVQILTNKPRNVFYVVAVTKVRDDSPFIFDLAFSKAAFGQDNLFERAQENFGVELRRAILDQMRGPDYYIVEGKERESFDSSDAT